MKRLSPKKSFPTNKTHWPRQSAQGVSSIHFNILIPQGRVLSAKSMQPSAPSLSMRWLRIALALWICAKIVGWLTTAPSPWGPKVGGTLPNGTAIYFQARKVGSETDDRLTVVAPDGMSKHYWVDQIHAGFDYVTIRYADSGDRVWVESDGKVGASIDLLTSDFRAEFSPQHTWAKIGDGTQLDAGATGSILWLLGPW